MRRLAIILLLILVVYSIICFIELPYPAPEDYTVVPVMLSSLYLSGASELYTGTFNASDIRGITVDVSAGNVVLTMGDKFCVKIYSEESFLFYSPAEEKMKIINIVDSILSIKVCGYGVLVTIPDKELESIYIKVKRGVLILDIRDISISSIKVITNFSFINITALNVVMDNLLLNITGGVVRGDVNVNPWSRNSKVGVYVNMSLGVINMIYRKPIYVYGDLYGDDAVILINNKESTCYQSIYYQSSSVRFKVRYLIWQSIFKLHIKYHENNMH